MVRVLLAIFQTDARAALRLLLSTNGVQVVEESTDWSTSLQLIKEVQPDMVIVDWEVVPTQSDCALASLRLLYPPIIIIVFINQLGKRQRDMISPEADVVINKSEMPDQIVQRILTATKRPPR